MTRARAVSGPADALGATIADLKQRIASLERIAHRHNTPDTAYRTEVLSFNPSPRFGLSNANLGSVVGEYSVDGPWVDFRVSFQATGTVGAGDFSCNIPVPALNPSNAWQPLGQATIRRSGVGWHQFPAILDGDLGHLSLNRGGTGGLVFVTNGSPFTWSSNDAMTIVGRYRRQ